MRCRHLVPAVVTLALFSAPAAAQPPSYPSPRLTVVAPPGAKAGTSVEVTVTGTDLEEATLWFSQPGLKAEPVPDPDPKKKGQFVANKFTVTVPAGTPLGAHDVRAVGKWGVSNPRVFVVGDLPEVAEKEPNNDVPQAQKVELNCTINGRLENNVDVDFYQFAGKKGQRVILAMACSSIDSRMEPEIRLYTAAGQLLGLNRRYLDHDALLDNVLPADGDYLVRVCGFAHLAGGPEHFYRLTISQGPWIDAAFPPMVSPGQATPVTLFGRNLPGGQPDPKALLDGRPLDRLTVQVSQPTDPPGQPRLLYSGTLPSQCGWIDGAEYTLKNAVGISNPVLLAPALGPIVLENEDNDTPEKAQVVPVPCDIAGRIEKKGDRDWYAFTAKANEVFSIEGFAERIGSPMDLYFEIRRADNKQMLGEFDDHTEQAPLTEFYGRTDDPKAKFTAPADGRYEIMVSSREAATSASPRHVYRLVIRKEVPDFRLVVTDSHTTYAGGCTVRQGGGATLEVICQRRDGFAGPVTVTVEGLPAGVTAQPLTLAPAVTRAMLVLMAAADAAPSVAPVTVKGTATVNGQNLVREARAGTVIWGLQPEQNVPTLGRLSRGVVVAVREKGPYTLEAATKTVAVPAGGTATVKVKAARTPDMKQPIQIGPITLPPQQPDLPPNVTFNNNNQPVTLPPDKAEIDVTVQVKPNVAPGTYSVALRGTAQVPFAKDPMAKQKPNVQVQEYLPPLQVTVYNAVAEVALGSPTVTLKANEKAEVVVKVTRQHGYDKEFKVQLVLPQGFAGVSAPEVTIPAGANEGKLVVQCAANAAPAMNPNVIVRAVATIDKVTLNHDAKLTVAIVK